MWDKLIGPIFGVLDRIIPDEKAREAAKLELLRQQQAGEMEMVKTQLSAIITEAQSADPWTSRARPTFLYVVYILILAALPMGVLSAFNPPLAKDIAAGMQAWLASIPSDIVDLFQWVMLGYVGARSIEKVKGASK